MTPDFLYDITQYNIIEDTVWSDIIRCAIAVLAALVAALLGKLYFEHRTGRMNKYAAWGALLTYISVGYAQLIALSTPGLSDNLTVLNLMVLVAMCLSLAGTLNVVHVALFFRKKASDDDIQ